MSRKRKREVVENAEYVTIGELVELSGMRYSTLKYYTEIGILPFVQEEERLVRRYPRAASLERLRQIRDIKENQQLTIEEIRERLSTVAEKSG